MLRVTKLNEDSKGVSLKVEGRISSTTIDDLERECRRFLQRGKSVQLELADVSFVGPSGVDRLKALRTHPVFFVSVPPLIRELIGTVLTSDDDYESTPSSMDDKINEQVRTHSERGPETNGLRLGKAAPHLSRRTAEGW